MVVVGGVLRGQTISICSEPLARQGQQEGCAPVVVVPTPPPMTLNGIRLSPPPDPGAWEHLVSSDMDLGSPRTGRGACVPGPLPYVKGKQHMHTHVASPAARGREASLRCFVPSVSPAAFSYLFNS